MIHRIKIEFTNGRPPHEYNLGPGPCGRTVTQLDVGVSDRWVSVRQEVAGEVDGAVFRYPAEAVFRVADYAYPEVCNVA